MILSSPKSVFYLFLTSLRHYKTHGHKTEERFLEEISKRDLKYFGVQIVKKRDEK